MPPPLTPSSVRFPLIGKILLTGTLIILLPFIAYLIAAATGTVRMFRIPTGSMQPTLRGGDTVFAVRHQPTASQLARGELVIFDATGMRYGDLQLQDFWPKRIAALPGDTITLKDGLLLVNGTTVDRDDLHAIAPSPVHGSPPLSFPLVVPSNHVFLLGDNFSNSLDSRYFGPIEIQRIKYRPTHRIAPTDRAGKIE